MTLALYHDTYPCTGECSRGALVLLHGWGMNSHVWDAVMPGLLEWFDVTLVDLPGMGRSPLPGGEYTLDAVVTHVLAVAPPRALWMGWSLGATVALRASALAPERLSGLVLVAGTPSFLVRDQWPEAMAVDTFDEFRGLLEEDAQGTVIRFLALQCKGSPSMRDDIRMLRERVFHDGIPATRALREGLRILAESDLREEWRVWTGPALIVLGAHDTLVPVQVGGAMTEAQRRARLAIIADAAHLPFVSAPELFLSALGDVLDELAPR